MKICHIPATDLRSFRTIIPHDSSSVSRRSYNGGWRSSVVKIRNAGRKLQEHLRYLEVIACNEAYQDALAVHCSLREAAKKGVNGAKTLYERLKKLFPGAIGRKTAETPAAEAQKPAA